MSDLPVAGDGLEGSVVAAERDIESDDGLAGTDQVQVLFVDAGLTGGFVVEELDLFEEAGLAVLVKTRSSNGNGFAGEAANGYGGERALAIGGGI